MKMKTNITQTLKITLNLACVAAAAMMVAACASESEEHESEGHENHANLQAQAKVSEADARATALTKVPDGKIKEGELEKEHGKLIWSFDIAKPNAEGISEINVDAVTGEIVAVEKVDKD